LRGFSLFDEIVIAIGVNSDKKPLFSPERRLKMISKMFQIVPCVKVCCYDGLTTDLAAKEETRYILRGVRTMSDFDYERTIAAANRKLSDIETVILFADPKTEHISSALVRELIVNKKPVKDFVPALLINSLD
jgi:pantetheine-phosphate adenylyltransferase